MPALCSSASPAANYDALQARVELWDSIVLRIDSADAFVVPHSTNSAIVHGRS